MINQDTITCDGWPNPPNWYVDAQNLTAPEIPEQNFAVFGVNNTLNVSIDCLSIDYESLAEKHGIDAKNLSVRTVFLKILDLYRESLFKILDLYGQHMNRKVLYIKNKIEALIELQQALFQVLYIMRYHQFYKNVIEHLNQEYQYKNELLVNMVNQIFNIKLS